MVPKILNCENNFEFFLSNNAYGNKLHNTPFLQKHHEKWIPCNTIHILKLNIEIKT